MKTLVLFVLLLLVGCSPRVVYITPELPLPPEPVLPTIEPVELECLSNEAYATLVQRDVRLREYVKVLRGIIKDNNEGN